MIFFWFFMCFKHNYPCMIFKVALKYLFEFYRKTEFENNWNKCNWNECNRMQAGNAIGIFFGILLEIFIGKRAKTVLKLGLL